MPVWGWILLIAGLSALAIAILASVVHHTHRRLPARQAAQGDAEDISAPLPMHVAKADDLMEGDSLTARELEEERQREAPARASDRVATYEISTAGSSPAEVVTNLPPAEVGQVLFHQGQFWRVDAIEPATSPEAAGRLIVSLTTDAPRPSPL